MKMKRSIMKSLFFLSLFTFVFSFQTFACPYKDFDTCIAEIGKELPPELKPFIEKQCGALGCRTPLNPIAKLSQDAKNNSSTNSSSKASKDKKILCKN